MNDKYIGGIFTACSCLLTTIQTNPVYQIINIILVVISLLVNIFYTIYKWYKNASADNNITSDEVEEVFKSVTDDINKAKSDIEDINKED